MDSWLYHVFLNDTYKQKWFTCLGGAYTFQFTIVPKTHCGCDFAYLTPVDVWVVYPWVSVWFDDEQDAISLFFYFDNVNLWNCSFVQEYMVE